MVPLNAAFKDFMSLLLMFCWPNHIPWSSLISIGWKWILLSGRGSATTKQWRRCIMLLYEAGWGQGVEISKSSETVIKSSIGRSPISV